MFMLNYDPKDLIGHHAGDIIKLHGKNWKLLQKSSTAIAIERYYFWNKWMDWVWKHMGGYFGNS
jgi:hypothetical protein